MQMTDVEARLAGLQTAARALSRQSETAMAGREDGSRTLIQSGDATIDQLGRMMEQTFGETYPVLRSSYGLQSFLTVMQDATRQYIAASDSAALTDLDKNFQKAFKSVAKRQKALLRRGTDETYHCD